VPRSPLKVNRRFGGTFRIHLDGRKISQARNQLESITDFLLRLFVDTEDGGDMFLRNVGWLPTDYTGLCPRIYESSHKILFVLNFNFKIFKRELWSESIKTKIVSQANSTGLGRGCVKCHTILKCNISLHPIPLFYSSSSCYVEVLFSFINVMTPKHINACVFIFESRVAEMWIDEKNIWRCNSRRSYAFPSL
jgi:hypothetical protein